MTIRNCFILILFVGTMTLLLNGCGSVSDGGASTVAHADSSGSVIAPTLKSLATDTFELVPTIATAYTIPTISGSISPSDCYFSNGVPNFIWTISPVGAAGVTMTDEDTCTPKLTLASTFVNDGGVMLIGTFQLANNVTFPLNVTLALEGTPVATVASIQNITSGKGETSGSAVPFKTDGNLKVVHVSSTGWKDSPTNENRLFSFTRPTVTSTGYTGTFNIAYTCRVNTIDSKTGKVGSAAMSGCPLVFKTPVATSTTDSFDFAGSSGFKFSSSFPSGSTDVRISVSAIATIPNSTQSSVSIDVASLDLEVN